MTLIVAMDMNFHLKNLIRSSLAKDPGLHTGFAYFLADGMGMDGDDNCLGEGRLKTQPVHTFTFLLSEVNWLRTRPTHKTK